MKVAIVMGTRPEAIKLAPVYHAFRARHCQVDVINTGQHRELIQPTLAVFAMTPTHHLDVIQRAGSLAELTSAMISELSELFSRESYDYVLVQGDTTSAMCAALAAFYCRIRIGHVEAGLRTGNRYSPFPEEANRRIISVLATDHFCPVPQSKINLDREGHGASGSIVTGNTVVDALMWIREHRGDEILAAVRTLGLTLRPFVLMTSHRRESFGQPLDNVLGAVRKYLAERPGVDLVLPLHMNPQARDPAIRALSGLSNARLIDAVDYVSFVALMKHAMFIVTDSGGIQEEAPYFGKRILVTRDVTERPEAVACGAATLVGTDPETVYTAMCGLDDAANRDVSIHANPFGDGHASERIVTHVLGQF